MYLTDYHVHPDYSVDAVPYSISQYCQRAVEIGINEICFTTHFECDPARRYIDWQVRVKGQSWPMEQWSWIESYFEDIQKARDEYKPLGLKIKAGVEVGYDLGLEPMIEKLSTSYPWDFIMGSVHCLNHMAISSHKESPKYFQGRTAREVCKSYYETMEEAVISRLFDCIGHLDLYKRYGNKFFGKEIDAIEREYAEKVLLLIAQNSQGIEINTSGIRRGSHFLPSLSLIKLAKSCGVKIFTVGSDSHRLSELGEGIVEARQTLLEHSLTCYSFDQRVALAVE